ncbi:hypothetical protein GCM10008941_04010 [Rhizomicrobium palustre]
MGCVKLAITLPLRRKVIQVSALLTSGREQSGAEMTPLCPTRKTLGLLAPRTQRGEAEKACPKE